MSTVSPAVEGSLLQPDFGAFFLYRKRVQDV